MLAFLCVLLVVVVVYIICFHYESIRAVYVAARIPGPAALPIIGNGLLFFNKSSPGNQNNNNMQQFRFQFDCLIGHAEQRTIAPNLLTNFRLYLITMIF